jgi:hypothetical protein
MWIYVIINADLTNLFTECSLMQDFALKGSPTENDYILILFIQAVEHFKRDGAFHSNKNNNLAPIFIQTKTIIPDSADLFNTRSQSVATTSSKISSKDNNDGLLGSVTSTFKGLFNK